MTEKMKLFTPSQAYVALLIGYFDENEALDWAHDYHANSPAPQAETPHFELLAINRKRADELARIAKLLGSVVAAGEPEFDVRSKSSEEVARQLFIARLRQYLEKECVPWAVCRMISRIEGLYDFPSWLGNMYDACDWVEPGATPADCRHMEEAVKAHLSGA